MRLLERVNIRTYVRTYVLTYIRTGQTLYPLHNFVVRGDNKRERAKIPMLTSTILMGIITSVLLSCMS